MESKSGVGAESSSSSALTSPSSTEEDLARLSEVSEDAIVTQLRLRFEHGAIYTCLGSVLVAVRARSI